VEKSHIVFSFRKELMRVVFFSTGILSLRQRMWTHISTRSHRALKLFPFIAADEPSATSAEREVMLYGTVRYGFKAGGGDEKDWAARAVLVMGGEGEGDEKGGEDGRQGWRMRFYQVYLVSLILSLLGF
jgi:hypothetical protein